MIVAPSSWMGSPNTRRTEIASCAPTSIFCASIFPSLLPGCREIVDDRGSGFGADHAAERGEQRPTAAGPDPRNLVERRLQVTHCPCLPVERDCKAVCLIPN